MSCGGHTVDYLSTVSFSVDTCCTVSLKLLMVGQMREMFYFLGVFEVMSKSCTEDIKTENCHVQCIGSIYNTEGVIP